MTSSATVRACRCCKGMPSWNSRSANPMIPRPIFRLPLTMRSMASKRVTGHVDGVVQKAHGGPDGLFEGVKVDEKSLSCSDHELGQVDGSQVTGFHGQQRLFAARVGAFDLAQFGRGVVTVDAVKKNDARIPVFPGLLNQGPIDLPGIERPRPAVPGIHQIVGAHRH
jgi:hypothetical protein